jgi:hypothetical protein
MDKFRLCMRSHIGERGVSRYVRDIEWTSETRRKMTI